VEFRQTGPREYSQRLVGRREFGGWLLTGQRVQDGALWDGGRLVETPEEDFYRAIGREYVAPKDRR
jgi:hypothetical protein